MRSAVVGAIGTGLLWLGGVRAVRADPPAVAPARDTPALPAPFAPLELLLAATDLVVEGTIAAPPAPSAVSAAAPPAGAVAIEVRRTVAGAEAGRRVLVAGPVSGEAPSLRHADLRRPPGTALLLLLQRTSPSAPAWTLVSSVDLASIEEAVLDLEGRAGGAAEHVETVVFFARLAGDRADPARDAARWAEGLRTGTPYLQQNLLLRVTGYGAFDGTDDAVVARVRAARAGRAALLLDAVVAAARRDPGPHPWALVPAWTALRGDAPDAAAAAEAALATGLASRDPAVVAPALRAAAGLALPGAVERAWALVADPSADDASRSVAMRALGDAALASAVNRAALRARDDLTATLRAALARPALKAAALEALEAIHHDARVTVTARNEASRLATWASPAATGPSGR